MAKIKTKTKSKTSIFLCCFGSHIPKKEKEPDDDDHVTKQKRSRWFSWLKIGKNRKPTSKTVPLEASFTNVNKAYSKSSRSKSSTLHKSKSQLTNHPQPLPAQPPLVLPGTPYYTPSQTRHGPKNNDAEDTREQVRGRPTRPKRQQERRQTTSKSINARGGSYDTLVGMSVLLVTLMIMTFWGRLCAILCTSSWLCFIPRFRKITTVNDDDGVKMKSNNVDLDSEEYKKKVIMEGLLGRNHRG